MAKERYAGLFLQKKICRRDHPFLPVARTFAPIIAGMIQMNYRKYVLYNVVGAILWCSSLACAGYFFGDNEWVQDNYGVAIIALIIIAIASILTRARVFSRR